MPALAGRAADPLRPHPCEVANLQEVMNLQEVTNLQEVSWLAGRHRVAKVELDRKAAGLRSARLPRLPTATGVTATALLDGRYN